MSAPPTQQQPQAPVVKSGVHKWIFGVGLPIQATALAVMQTLCHSGLFDNPITYTSALSAIIAVIGYFKNEHGQ